VSIDPRAATGFGSRVEAYERGRPQYPPDAINGLAREFRLTQDSSTVLDLAAGTGKLTRQLIPIAGRVIAVEPSAAMRAELAHQVPAAEIREGTAEDIPLQDASAAAVFVGQAFHWFRPAEAFAEIARVLTPGGGLALLWNRAQWQAPWAERFQALVDPPRVAAGEFPSGEEMLARSPQFEAWQEGHYRHVHRIGIEDFIALVSSWSWIANLPDDERGELLAEVRDLVRGTDVLELAYATEVYWTRRRG
jgi:SAM-dependent methyltransferase